MMHRDLAEERVIAARQYENEKEYWLNKMSGELTKSGFPPDDEALRKAFGCSYVGIAWNGRALSGRDLEIPMLRGLQVRILPPGLF